MKVLENLIVEWADISSNLVDIEALIFIKIGEEEISNKINETKEALASRGVKYGFKYDEIVKKYKLDENTKGNLLGDFKYNLVTLNNIYKKAYKSVIDAKIKATTELRKLLNIILKLQTEKTKLKQTFIDYQKHERKLKQLTEKVKQAIANGMQNEALQISNEISNEKENNPLKDYNNRLTLFISQINVYEEIIIDCEQKLDSFCEERKKKFEKTIIIEPVTSKAITTQRKGFFNRK